MDFTAAVVLSVLAAATPLPVTKPWWRAYPPIAASCP